MSENNDYPFYTEEIDGELLTGIAFNPTTGKFFETVPNSEAEAPIDVRCPRTGKRVQWESTFQQTISKAMAGWVFATYPAEKWAKKRETYIEAPDSKQNQWEDMWGEISDTPVSA